MYENSRTNYNALYGLFATGKTDILQVAFMEIRISVQSRCYCEFRGNAIIDQTQMPYRHNVVKEKPIDNIFSFDAVYTPIIV